MNILSAKLSSSQIKEATDLSNNWEREQLGDFQELPFSITFNKGHFAKLPFCFAVGHVFIEATIQNKRRINMMVDTGSPSSLLDEKTADGFLNSPSGLYGLVRPMSRGMPVLEPQLHNVAVGLPGLGLNRTTFLKGKLSQLDAFTGMHVDGILGYDVLKHFVINFDFPNRTMELWDPKWFAPDELEESVPLLDHKFGIAVGVTVVDHYGHSAVVDLRIDTGSEAIAAFSRDSVDGGLRLDPLDKYADSVFTLSDEMKSVRSNCDGIKLGTVMFKNPPVDVMPEMVDYDKNGLIGTGLLQRIDCSVDPTRMRMFFKPNATFIMEFPRNRSGLNVISKGSELKTLEVEEVIPDSPADQAGFKVKDILLKFDDQNLEQLSRDQAHELFKKPGLHRVLVSRAGKTVALDLQGLSSALKTSPDGNAVKRSSE